MNTATALQNNTTKSQPVSSPSHPRLLLQRKCACGGAISAPLAGECEQCTKRRLQTKLTIGASNDPLEQEADRIADQVMASPGHGAINSTPVKIQRFTGNPSGQGMEVPASVERVLASPGRPLETGLREEMEGRFGHDFSRVRVHTGGAAERSARDVSAYAYTVGNNIVFGAGQYSPGSQNRRQLLVHELVHVVQQSDGRPLVQRDGDEDRLRQDFGTQVSDAYLSVELGEIPTRSVGMLLWRAQEYFNHMQEGGDSLLSGSQYAYLTLQIFLELSLRAEVAPRDPMDNALLTGPVGQVVDIFAVAAGTPWHANRPKTVEEISPFNNDMENVRETAMPEIERRSGVFEPDAHIATPGLSAMVEQRLARIETRLTEGVAEVENGETEAPLSSEWILSSMPSQTPTLIQETLPGSRVLEEGLQLLRESPYWDRIGEIWFLGRRLFFLDKEGHLQGAEDSSVRLQQRTGRGGTTFFVSLDTSAHTAAGMIQLGTESMVRGERDVVIVRPITVLSGMTPILNRRDRLAQTGRGVGIIVAPLFARVTNTQEAIEYLIEAMGRAIRIMPWAIYQTAVNMMENPRSALLEVALELGIEYISRRAPVIGQAVQGVQMLQLAAWLGDVSNIAMYAQTDEEITFAAEAISLRVAEEALSELLSGAASHTLGALRVSTRSGSDASVDSFGRGQGDTSPGTLLDPSNPPVRTPELGTDVNPVIDASRVSGREIETNETVDPVHREAIVPPPPRAYQSVPDVSLDHSSISSRQTPTPVSRETVPEYGSTLPVSEPLDTIPPSDTISEGQEIESGPVYASSRAESVSTVEPHIHDMPNVEPRRSAVTDGAQEALPSTSGREIITPQEAINEVEYIERHPELVEGAAPNQHARIGDHEIVQVEGGCVRRSIEIPVPCPVSFRGASAEGEGASFQFEYHQEVEAPVVEPGDVPPIQSTGEPITASREGAPVEEVSDHLAEVLTESTEGTIHTSPSDIDILSSPTSEQAASELSAGTSQSRFSTREVWDPPGGAAARPPLTAPLELRQEWLHDRLQIHVDQAIERYRLESLTPAQEAVLLDRPSLERAFRGSRIDQFAKDSILQDPELVEIITAPDFISEPDILDSVFPTWFDITTRAQWSAHLRRYGRRYGVGTGRRLRAD